MKSGNLNFMDTSVPLQACNGTDLPLLCSKYLVIMWVVLDEMIIQFCLEDFGKEIFVDGNVTTGHFS